MADSYSQILYHIVFSTKDRRPSILAERREDLYAYIWGINQKLDCHLYRIGGVADHLHLLTEIHPKLALADYVEQVKTGSTNWIQKESVFSMWPKWQRGYGAFTESWSEKDRLIEYIKNQEEHHKRETFEDEYRKLLLKAGVRFDERYVL